MFEVSRRADYAVRTMLALGELAPGERRSARRIAAQMGIPQPFLYKIIADLVEAGLVETQAGPKGGLQLAKSCDEINLLHILEAIEGPICVNICLTRPKECPRDAICPAHGLWGRLQASIVAQLQAATLAELVAEAQLLKAAPRRLAANYLHFEESQSEMIDLVPVEHQSV